MVSEEDELREPVFDLVFPLGLFSGLHYFNYFLIVQ